MPPKKNTKRAKAPSALDRRGKKKVSILTQEKIEYVDWKDVNPVSYTHLRAHETV